MNIKLLLVMIISFVLTSNSFAAGSANDDNSSKIKNNYDKAVVRIKSAKKYEKKGKTDKAKKNCEKALKLLEKANIKDPNNADTLNYLGFTTRKLGNFSKGEEYYLQGLAINPKHIGINEYLGELYVATNRVSLAKERLKVLENCKCDEFEVLKSVINSGNSKY